MVDWAKTFAEIANTPRRVIPQHGLGRMLNPLRTRRDYCTVGRPTFLVETLPEPTEAQKLRWERLRFLGALRWRPEPNPWDEFPLET